MIRELSKEERSQLERDCRESGVPVAVEDQNAIKRVVGLIRKNSGGRR